MAKKKDPEFNPPLWVPREPWDAWIEVRKAKGIPNTIGAMNLAVSQLNKIREMGFDPGDVLDEATQKGWSGVMVRFFENRKPPRRPSKSLPGSENPVYSAGPTTFIVPT